MQILFHALLLACNPPGVRLEFLPKTGDVLARRFESHLELRKNDSYWGPYELEEHRTTEIVDRYLEVDEGSPVEFSRRFRTANSRRRFTSLVTGWGGASQTEEVTGWIQGQTIRFKADLDDERGYSAECRAGTAYRERLEQLDPDVDLRGLLPGYEVEVGERWLVHANVIRMLLDPGGGGAGVVEGNQPILDDRLLARFESELTVRLDELSESNEGLLAKLEVSGSGDVEDELAGADAPMSYGGQADYQERRLELRVEGVVWWDLGRNRLFALELDADVRLELETLWVLRQYDLEHRMELIDTWEGSLQLEVEPLRVPACGH